MTRIAAVAPSSPLGLTARLLEAHVELRPARATRANVGALLALAAAAPHSDVRRPNPPTALAPFTARSRARFLRARLDAPPRRRNLMISQAREPRPLSFS